MVKQGDIIKLRFHPQKGHEQAGYRPAVVVSNSILNAHTTLSMLCPVTHTNRNSPFHVEITNNPDLDGFVMCDQLKSLDLNERKYKKIGRVSDSHMEMILDRIAMLLEREPIA